MKEHTYIPVGNKIKTYIFPARVEREEDGRWSAWIEQLPGCAVWGYTREEAVEALHEGAQAYMDVLREQGSTIPSNEDVTIAERPLIAVTV